MDELGWFQVTKLAYDAEGEICYEESWLPQELKGSGAAGFPEDWEQRPNALPGFPGALWPLSAPPCRPSPYSMQTACSVLLAVHQALSSQVTTSEVPATWED